VRTSEQKKHVRRSLKDAERIYQQTNVHLHLTEEHDRLHRTTDIYGRLEKGKSPWSSVSINTGYGLDDWGSIPNRGNYRNFSFHHHFQAGPGAHPASSAMGTGRSYLGVKRWRRKADH